MFSQDRGKKILLAKLCVCSMHGTAAGAHHTALGSPPPSQQRQELLSQPSQAMCDWTGALTSAQGGDAEPFAGSVVLS